MTESTYTTTFRLPAQDAPQLTVRADDAESFVEALTQVPELVAAIQVASDTYRSVLTVSGTLGGTVVDVQSTPTQTSQGGRPAQSSNASQGQGAASNLLLEGKHQILVDTKFGTKVVEYNRPDAPSSVRGPKAILTQKSSKGNWYSQWVDPSDTPAWFPRPKVDLNERKNAREWVDDDTEFDHTPYLPNE